VFNIKIKNQILNLFNINDNEQKLIQNFEGAKKY
jgi:hypothetical protein